MSSAATTRKSQRQPLSCTECARRKLRCSKSIPCSCCIDRGRADSCRREVVQVSSRARRRRASQSSSGAPTAIAEPSMTISPSPHQQPASNPITVQSPSDTRVNQHREDNFVGLSRTPQSSNLLNTSNDTAVTLEFLALGRQNILSRRIQNDETLNSASPNSQPGHAIHPAFQSVGRWDLIVSQAQARQLLDYHQAYLAWMHNVIHCPTLRAEFEANLHRETVSKAWLAVYYAIISTTLYHADDDSLREMGLEISPEYVVNVYEQSLRALHDASFMSVHTIHSVQTICILLQVAHNLGQSDQISVLLACAIKIAQSINLHRLGSDISVPSAGRSQQALIDREVKKRVWWFLVRQDWLQIPFQNTYSIHITQFNTPMPLNCYEDPERMVRCREVLDNHIDVYTQSSYSNVLNQVSVVVWRHQDRLVSVGHPEKSSDGIYKLYDQVLLADEELRDVWRKMPKFLHDENIELAEWPHNVAHIKRIHHLSMAHKMFTIHRHFQMQSFKDGWYAFTRMSCVSIAQKCLRDMEFWPMEKSTQIASKMWTVLTHCISCSVLLLFALIFNRDHDLIYDSSELRRLVLVGRNFISNMVPWSTIATRGVKLIDVLLEFENATSQGQDVALGVEDVIAYVRGDNNTVISELPLEGDNGVNFGMEFWDSTLAFMFDVDTVFG